MKERRLLVPLAAAAALALGANGPCPGPTGPAVQQQVITLPGVVEPHTPGSGAPEEMATAEVIETLLGPAPDLNRVTYVRTALDEPPGTAPPRVVVLAIPGFLGGATTYDPLARDLVRRFNGNVEVWAVDRRPNQLEDRLGATFAIASADSPACQASPPEPGCSIFEGAQFYFPDLDVDPFGDFPGPGDLDLDLDSEFDEQIPLVDGFGAERFPALVTQDDARFMAYWGLDTYFRDWKLLVDVARALVGPSGLVLLAGHSQGTTWASTFAAYDFDPDPAVVVAGHSLVDGLLLMEGGGVGPGNATKPTLAQYEATIDGLATSGGPDVFLSSFSGISLVDLGTSGEVASIAAYYQPLESALIQRTPSFGAGIPSQVLSAPATNRAIAGMFLDDDFSTNGAFRAAMGFTDNGPNFYQTPIPGLFQVAFYKANPAPGGALRQWKDWNDPTLPTCPPNVFNKSPGCAILDNGPPSAPADPPKTNGVEREVTPVNAFLQTQFGKANGFEWYFASGRPNLDFAYGRDSSALVAEHLALHPGDEGPLVVTQNASMDLPVLCIGGSNGLAPEPKSFDRYLDSIATPEADQEVHILTGYAHLDPLTARNNEAVPLIESWISRLLQRKLLETF